jgi:hypothetical protein
MKPGFCKLKATAGTGNTRNRSIWRAQQNLSANAVLALSPIRTSLISDEVITDLYDITAPPLVYTFQSYGLIPVIGVCIAVVT